MVDYAEALPDYRLGVRGGGFRRAPGGAGCSSVLGFAAADGFAQRRDRRGCGRRFREVVKTRVSSRHPCQQWLPLLARAEVTIDAAEPLRTIEFPPRLTHSSSRLRPASEYSPFDP